MTATYTLAVELTSGEQLGTHTCSKRFERDTTWGSLNIIDRDVALERSRSDDTLIVRLCELHIIDTKATTSAGPSAPCAAVNPVLTLTLCRRPQTGMMRRGASSAFHAG